MAKENLGWSLTAVAVLLLVTNGRTDWLVILMPIALATGLVIGRSTRSGVRLTHGTEKR
jgi:hypothetical protein